MSGPISRVLSRVIIYLRICIAAYFMRRTRKVSEQLHPFPIRPCSRWGLPSLRLTTELVVSCTTVSALLRINARGFLFCGTFLIPKSKNCCMWHPELVSGSCVNVILNLIQNPLQLSITVISNKCEKSYYKSIKISPCCAHRNDIPKTFGTVAAGNHLALRSPDFPLRSLGAITQPTHTYSNSKDSHNQERLISPLSY